MLTARSLSTAAVALLFSLGVFATAAPPSTITPNTKAPAAGASSQIAQGDEVDIAGVQLEPRVPLPKQATSSIVMPINSITWKPEVTGRVLVKFMDSVKARAPRQPSASIESAIGMNLNSAVNALAGTGSVAWQAIERDQKELSELQQRAEAHSGKQALDLAGFIYVVPANDDLVACAKAFNDLPEVEFVVIEQVPFQAQKQQGAQTGCATAPGDPCQLSPGAVNSNKPGIASGPAVPPWGRCSDFTNGSACSDDCNEPCPMMMDDKNCMLGSNDQTCCGTVTGFFPACTAAGHGWDALCAMYANSVCDSTVYDTLTPISGNNKSAPSTYKYDPCFALRCGPNPLAPDFPVQAKYASTLGLPASVNFPLELVQVTSFSTNVSVPPPDGDSGLTATVATTAVNPAFPSSAKFAMQDPSFERLPYEVSPTCFTTHPGRKGCNNTPCCVYVCLIDPACCTILWDEGCVSVASKIDANNPCVQPLAGSMAASVAPGPSDFPMINMANFPANGSTPSFKGTEVNTGFGKQARNLQVWNVASPVAANLEQLDIDPAVGRFAVTPPINSAQLANSRLFLNTGFRGGGFDLSGFEGAAGSIGVPTNKARGDGITIGVIDNSAFVNHEDISGRVAVEPGVGIVTSLGGNVNPHHGTAVLGILVGKDNGVGVTGVAQDSTAMFFPAFAGGGIGGRFFNAFTSANALLKSGDVICIPLDFPVAITDPVTGVTTILTGTVLQSPEVFALAQLSDQLGISVVVAAGNNCTGVKTVPGGGGGGVTTPTNSIVVGAVWPGAQRFTAVFQGLRYCRSDFSNFTDAGGGAGGAGGEVDICGWGAYVTTCGYGDLWRGTNGSSNNDEVNNLRTYTMQFGGTSAAAAMVAGGVARMQSTANALFGTPLSTSQVRSSVRANVAPQCGFPEGSPLQLGSTVPCIGDNQTGAQVNAIRGFFNFGPQLLTTLANQPFGSLPTDVTNYQVQILIGTLLSGSVYSLRSDDSVWMKIQARRPGGFGASAGVGPPLFYPPSAVVSDIMVTITTTYTNQKQLTDLGVTGAGQAHPGTYAYTIFFVFNPNSNRWLMLPNTLTFFAAATNVEPDGDATIDAGDIAQTYNAMNLIDMSSGVGKIRVRAVTIGPPIGGGYQIWWDAIGIIPNPPPTPPPCWVAQSVYGKENPRWVMFREWLDQRAPASFRNAYTKYGQSVAKWLDANPSAKPLVRPFLDSAISTLNERQATHAMGVWSKMPAGQQMVNGLKQIAEQQAAERE